MLGSLVFGDVVRRKAVLCHCRGHFTASAGSLVSRILPRVRYIFDMRGDVANETMMSVGWTGAASDRRGAAVCEKIKRDEAASIKNASGIICVSESLGRKISKEYPNTIGKLVVIPCLAPERLFFFDPSVRAAKRKMLGLENRRVVVYAGALKAPWHIPDALFGHFKAWSCLDESLHFLVVTRDPDTAFTMVRKYAIPAAVFTILSVSHREVATLLMAGDCGLLLREDHQLNKVASPTKFAEYAMTGLPVMASRGIGDLDELITAQGLGVILDKLDSTEESFIVLRKALALPSENSCRAERAERARRQFSAEVGNEKRLRLYAKAGTP
jgi:glycosyltransferase involved in cell wall biosynthesis